MAGPIHLLLREKKKEEGGWEDGLYLTAQQPPRRVFGSAALGRVFGFVLVVVGLVVFDDVILATEEGDHT